MPRRSPGPPVVRVPPMIWHPASEPPSSNRLVRLKVRRVGGKLMTMRARHWRSCWRDAADRAIRSHSPVEWSDLTPPEEGEKGE